MLKWPAVARTELPPTPRRLASRAKQDAERSGVGALGVARAGLLTARVDQLEVATGASRYGAVPQSALFGKALGMLMSSLRPVPSGFMVQRSSRAVFPVGVKWVKTILVPSGAQAGLNDCCDSRVEQSTVRCSHRAGSSRWWPACRAAGPVGGKEGRSAVG